MSFNIRLGVANDGENRWDLRKDLVVKTIRGYNPDLLGLQEVFPMQEEYLRENFFGIFLLWEKPVGRSERWRGMFDNVSKGPVRRDRKVNLLAFGNRE